MEGGKGEGHMFTPPIELICSFFCVCTLWESGMKSLYIQYDDQKKTDGIVYVLPSTTHRGHSPPVPRSSPGFDVSSVVYPAMVDLPQALSQ